MEIDNGKSVISRIVRRIGRQGDNLSASAVRPHIHCRRNLESSLGRAEDIHHRSIALVRSQLERIGRQRKSGRNIERTAHRHRSVGGVGGQIVRLAARDRKIFGGKPACEANRPRRKSNCQKFIVHALPSDRRINTILCSVE